jgi:hypothetical protein
MHGILITSVSNLNLKIVCCKLLREATLTRKGKNFAHTAQMKTPYGLGEMLGAAEINDCCPDMWYLAVKSIQTQSYFPTTHTPSSLTCRS